MNTRSALKDQQYTAENQNKEENKSTGLNFPRQFSSEERKPFDTIKWETRDAVIANDRGEQVFEQKGVEVPAFWSQMATNVVVSKYFRGAVGKPERETSVKQLISRVADTISGWGEKDRYFRNKQQAEVFNQELTALLLNQYAAFNSPVWFNVGVEENPQCSACFILSVDDSIDGLLDLQKTEAKLFKYGSGAGSNLSTIRSSKESLKGGGTASGPLSFMRGYDSWAGTIKSGGKTRRAAKMQILNVQHPDIQEFVNAKRTEEEKAWALIEQGYSGAFNAAGGAYDSVFFQNSNFSVRATDEFMEAVLTGSKFATRAVTNNETIEELDAKKMLLDIAHGTWVCGDPGMQFDDIINDWHTCPESGRINASNPCSEYMHIDNSACNLASINLLKFLDEDGSFDVNAFIKAVDLLITAQDILINNSHYPTPEIADNARSFRQLGLGFANLGALLMSNGMAYDSEEGRAYAASITAIMCGEAYAMSARLASELGAFYEYPKNRDSMIRVIKNHKEFADNLPALLHPSNLNAEVIRTWQDALDLGLEYGFRNSQTTVLAPTGTIAFLMDCDTTGIEPDIALVKYKRMVDGGMLKIVNNSVPRALKNLGYNQEQVTDIISYIEDFETIEENQVLKSGHLSVFDCAFKPLNGSRTIHHGGHLKMMAACQPFISGAISKTVNLPESASVEDIFHSYVEAWKMGLKAVAIYRDNSKRSQPLGTSKKVKSNSETVNASKRRRLPEERAAITHKFNIANHQGYITVGLFEDSTPGEIFVVMSKEGSTLSGVMDAFATSISMALQYGVPIEVLIKKFAHMRFEPSGMTPNKQIPFAKSIMDYLFRWLASKFMSKEEQSAIGLLQVENKSADHDVSKVKINGENNPMTANINYKSESLDISFQIAEDVPPCTVCESYLMVRQGACHRCLNCGSQGGCG